MNQSWTKNRLNNTNFLIAKNIYNSGGKDINIPLDEYREIYDQELGPDTEGVSSQYLINQMYLTAKDAKNSKAEIKRKEKRENKQKRNLFFNFPPKPSYDGQKFFATLKDENQIKLRRKKRMKAKLKDKSKIFYHNTL